jgi:hypothetical protein
MSVLAAFLLMEDQSPWMIAKTETRLDLLKRRLELIVRH